MDATRADGGVRNSSGLRESMSDPYGNVDFSTDDVAQELRTLRDLRRLSLDGNNLDPDLRPTTYERSPSVTSSPTGSEDDDILADDSVWVPANIHPEIAPQEWQTYVQKKERHGYEGPDFGQRSVGRKLSRSASLLSRQVTEAAADEYVDAGPELARRRSQKRPQWRIADIHRSASRLSQSSPTSEEPPSPDLDGGGGGEGGDDAPLLKPVPGQILRRTARTGKGTRRAPPGQRRFDTRRNVTSPTPTAQPEAGAEQPHVEGIDGQRPGVRRVKSPIVFEAESLDLREDAVRQTVIAATPTSHATSTEPQPAVGSIETLQRRKTKNRVTQVLGPKATGAAPVSPTGSERDAMPPLPDDWSAQLQRQRQQELRDLVAQHPTVTTRPSQRAPNDASTNRETRQERPLEHHYRHPTRQPIVLDSAHSAERDGDRRVGLQVNTNFHESRFEDPRSGIRLVSPVQEFTPNVHQAEGDPRKSEAQRSPTFTQSINNALSDEQQRPVEEPVKAPPPMRPVLRREASGSSYTRASSTTAPSTVQPQPAPSVADVAPLAPNRPLAQQSVQQSPTSHVQTPTQVQGPTQIPPSISVQPPTPMSPQVAPQPASAPPLHQQQQQAQAQVQAQQVQQPVQQTPQASSPAPPAAEPKKSTWGKLFSASTDDKKTKAGTAGAKLKRTTSKESTSASSSPVLGSGEKDASAASNTGIFSSIFGGGKKKDKENAGGSDTSPRKDGSVSGAAAAAASGGRTRSTSPRRRQPLQQEPPPHFYTRYPIQLERAIYRMAHLKLSNPRRPLAQQVVLSNFMYGYLALIGAGHSAAAQNPAAAAARQRAKAGISPTGGASGANSGSGGSAGQGTGSGKGTPASPGFSGASLAHSSHGSHGAHGGGGTAGGGSSRAGTVGGGTQMSVLTTDDRNGGRHTPSFAQRQQADSIMGTPSRPASHARNRPLT